MNHLYRVSVGFPQAQIEYLQDSSISRGYRQSSVTILACSSLLDSSHGHKLSFALLAFTIIRRRFWVSDLSQEEAPPVSMTPSSILDTLNLLPFFLHCAGVQLCGPFFK